MRIFGLQVAMPVFVSLLAVGMLGCSTEPDLSPLSNNTSLSPAAEPNPGQEQAIAEIKKLGGSVRFGPGSPQKPVVFVWLRGPKVTNGGLEHLKGHLKGLTKLKGLHLSTTQVTDDGLEHLKELTNLQILYLDNTQITDTGLIHLKGLTNLRKLNLQNTQITDAGLMHLKGLTNLKTLYLLGTQISDEGIEKLHLSLTNCEVEH